MRKDRIFWGIVMLLAAAGLLVGKLGFFGDINLFTLFATAFLVLMILKNLFPINYAGILFPIAFLCILYDEPLGIEELTPWTVILVAAFASVGLDMLFGHHCPWRKCQEDDFVVVDVEDDSQVRQKTTFGASSKYINSEDFKQAELECSFGAMKVYFDKAVVPSGQATVRIYSNFAGMELYIPREWTVINKMSMSLGAVDEKNKNTPDGRVTLTLTGSGSFSGIEIIYV